MGFKDKKVKRPNHIDPVAIKISHILMEDLTLNLEVVGTNIAKYPPYTLDRLSSIYESGIYCRKLIWESGKYKSDTLVNLDYLNNDSTKLEENKAKKLVQVINTSSPILDYTLGSDLVRNCQKSVFDRFEVVYLSAEAEHLKLFGKRKKPR